MALLLHTPSKKKRSGLPCAALGGFMDMRRVYISDLVDQGYIWPETSLVSNLWSDLGEDDPNQEPLVIQELLLSRN